MQKQIKNKLIQIEIYRIKQITFTAIAFFFLKISFGQELKTEKIADVNVNLNPPIIAGTKIIYTVKSGTIKGKINGTVLPIGGDFTSKIGDTNIKLDVREVIQTDDSSTIYIIKSGFIYADSSNFYKIVTGQGKDLSSDKYYFRSTYIFETNSKKYDWLNHTIGIAIGTITEYGISYKLFAVN
jgi:hypothetical protein